MGETLVEEKGRKEGRREGGEKRGGLSDGPVQQVRVIHSMMQSVYGDDDEHHDDEDDHYNDTHTDSSWLGRLLYMDVQRACMGI